MNLYAKAGRNSSLQPVEKPGHASSVNRFFRIYGQDQEEGKGRNSVLPQPSGQLFQIHGSKFKLHPVCYLGQASVLSIAHGVFFLGVGKDSFNSLLAPLVQILILWGVRCQDRGYNNFLLSAGQAERPAVRLARSTGLSPEPPRNPLLFLCIKRVTPHQKLRC